MRTPRSPGPLPLPQPQPSAGPPRLPARDPGRSASASGTVLVPLPGSSVRDTDEDRAPLARRGDEEGLNALSRRCNAASGVRDRRKPGSSFRAGVLVLATAAVVVGTGCMGTVGDPRGGWEPSPGPVDPTVEPPGLTPEDNPDELDADELFACTPETDLGGGTRPRLWRLTSSQFRYTHLGSRRVRDRVERRLTLDGIPQTSRFVNYASNRGMDEPTFEGMWFVATEMAAFEVGERHFPECGEEGQPELPGLDCYRGYLRGKLRQWFRRPPTDAEVDRYAQRIVDAVPSLGPTQAAILGMSTALASPEALFRWEVGDGTTLPDGRRQLGPWELANALAFSLTREGPDDELSAAAAEGRLGTPDQVRPHVERLLGLPAESATLRRFLREYTRYHEAGETFKDDDHLRTQRRADPDFKYRPQDDVAATDEWVRELLAEPTDFVGQLLTRDIGTAPDRAGLLTQNSMLIRYSEFYRTDPIRRGEFITRSLLCVDLPDIPLDVVADISTDPAMTLRERLAEHSSNPGCAGCHQHLDGIGLGLERFDDFGRHRTMEAGRPLDTTGELVGSDVDGTFDGPVELSERLAGSDQVRRCVLRHAFRFTLGRNERQEDACSLSAMEDAYLDSDGNLVEALVALFLSDAFLTRNPELDR